MNWMITLQDKRQDKVIYKIWQKLSRASLVCFLSRAFSCDIMLPSIMAASIATEINIHSCKHLFALLCITVFSPWASAFVVQVHDDRMRTWCVWLPWISRSVCAIRRPCWRTAWCQWKASISTSIKLTKSVCCRTWVCAGASRSWHKLKTKIYTALDERKTCGSISNTRE